MRVRGGRVPFDVDVDVAVALHIPARGELACGELRLLVCPEPHRGGEAERGASRERVARLHDAGEVERRELRGRRVAELPSAVVPAVRNAHVRARLVDYVGVGVKVRGGGWGRRVDVPKRTVSPEDPKGVT